MPDTRARTSTCFDPSTCPTMSNRIGTLRGSTVSVRTEIGVAAVAAGAAASLPHAARQPSNSSAAQRFTAYEDNRRKKGIDAFPDGGMTGIENGKRATGSSAGAHDYIQSPRGPSDEDQTNVRSRGWRYAGGTSVVAVAAAVRCRAGLSVQADPAGRAFSGR